MTDADPRRADSNRRTTDPSGHPDVDDDGDVEGDDRPRMRDVDQTGPDELDANGVWSRGPATSPGAEADETAPADD